MGNFVYRKFIPSSQVECKIGNMHHWVSALYTSIRRLGMSDQEKDKKEYEFIKESVVEQKQKKFKKWLFPPMLTLLLAILFGLVASVTIIVAEPRLKKLFENDDARKPVYLPSDDVSEDITSPTNPVTFVTPTPKVTPVVVKDNTPADINDYISMNDDIKEVALSASKSILNIRSKFEIEDIFKNSILKTVNTTGLIIYKNSTELLVLVSLDKVKDAKSVRVILNDTVSVNAKLLDYESELNLAILSIPITEIPTVYMNDLQVAKLGESYSVLVGNPIIALGSPNGHAGSMEYGMVTSRGISLGITDNVMDLFNTSIIDNKSSDGIIFDLKGQVVGIITQALKEKGYENLNTNIGISKLRPFIMAMGNKVPRIYCGVKTDDMNSETKAQYGVGNGIYVKEVIADSPAFKAGIQNGDIILQVGDRNILSSTNFYETINKFKSGEKAKFKILRSVKDKDTNLTLTVTLAKKAK